MGKTAFAMAWESEARWGIHGLIFDRAPLRFNVFVAPGYCRHFMRLLWSMAMLLTCHRRLLSRVQVFKTNLLG